jgi:hypothetical protein
MAGKAKGFLSAVSQIPLACRCPRHTPANGDERAQVFRCWMLSTCARAHAAERANGSRHVQAAQDGIG